MGSLQNAAVLFCIFKLEGEKSESHNCIQGDILMDGQLSLFDFISQSKLHPGDLVDSSQVGKTLSFNEIAKRIGDILILSQEVTSKYTFNKVIKIVDIMKYEYIPGQLACDGKRRFVYDDGTNQKGYVSEDYLDKEIYPFYGEVHEIIKN